MASIQTLSEEDRRRLARWAAVCAGRVVPLVEGPAEVVEVVRDAVSRAAAFGEGKSTAAAEIAKRLTAATAAGAASTPAGAAAARAAGQAAAVAHMGAHALGAAAYAAKAVSLAAPDNPVAARDAEVRWQLAQLTEEDRIALRRLPKLGTNAAGPLGPGLLSKGVLGEAIRAIQDQLG